MSWLYSRALVEAYSQGTSLDGGPCAPSSGTPTPQAYSSHGRMTDFSRLSRFGMMSSPLTDDHGEAVLMWCLEASLVRTSALQAKAQASTESVPACGDTWRGSFARWHHDSSSWKTRQPSLFEDSTECSVTWPRWGTMRDGACSERTTPVLRTSANGSGLWPTPVADGDRTTNYAQGGTSLGFAARNWPTPTAHNAKEFNSPSEALRNEPTLAARAGGTLNPTWVEWLMGWPLGWTDLKPLATDRFRQWRRSHGKR